MQFRSFSILIQSLSVFVTKSYFGHGIEDFKNFHIINLFLCEKNINISYYESSLICNVFLMDKLYCGLQ
jgi:hypothetical protein